MGLTKHLRRFKFRQYILLFHNNLPLELGKGLNPDHPNMLSAKFVVLEKHGPSFEQNEIPFYKGCLVPCLVKIGPMVLEKENLKFLLSFGIS